MSASEPAAGPALSRRIVRAARALTFDQLAPEVIAKVKTGLLDFLSCAYEARTLPWGEQAIAMAGQAGGPAIIIGTPHRAAAPEAAFANATLGHGLVREDMHPAAVSHLGVVIYPTLLALSATQSVTGRDLIVGAVCGYEVGAAIGRALMDQDLVHRFRPTGITGPLAGAMAAARLLSLDENAAVSALGFAANATGGLNEWPHSGADDMFFHPGFAARNAVTAVQLARAGARASETALDGVSGLFAALGRVDCIAAVAPFGGNPLEILSVYNKPAPACNYAQTACQAALACCQQPSAEIKAIAVELPAAAVNYPGCNYAGPFERILQAKMSIQYCVAATLARGVIEEANYHQLADPEILRLASLIKLEVDDAFTATYPSAQGAEVIVSLHSGETVSHRKNDLVPATEDEIRTRFRAASGTAATAMEATIDLLEKHQNVDVLCDLLRVTPSVNSLVP